VPWPANSLKPLALSSLLLKKLLEDVFPQMKKKVTRALGNGILYRRELRRAPSKFVDEYRMPEEQAVLVGRGEESAVRVISKTKERIPD